MAIVSATDPGQRHGHADRRRHAAHGPDLQARRQLLQRPRPAVARHFTYTLTGIDGALTGGPARLCRSPSRASMTRSHRYLRDPPARGARRRSSLPRADPHHRHAGDDVIITTAPPTRSTGAPATTRSARGAATTPSTAARPRRDPRRSRQRPPSTATAATTACSAAPAPTPARRHGNDRTGGGTGNDRVDGGPATTARRVALSGRGNDRLFGGSGNDRIRTAGGTKDTVDCGPGTTSRCSTPATSNAAATAPAASPRSEAERTGTRRPRDTLR